ncbi:transglutaminase domain-containing protein [Chloroflexota bacterium]
MFVLYPNPGNLVATGQRIFNPSPDPDAVASLAETMPSDAEAIKIAVKEMIPFSCDWETYGMPWYCPTVPQVLEKAKGDCKARALVLASILEAKGIPCTINYSTVHVWVEYENKEVSASENDEVKLFQQDPVTGERSVGIPSISSTAIKNEFLDTLWRPMPMTRKALLFCGLAVLVWLRLRHWKRVLGTKRTA